MLLWSEAADLVTNPSVLFSTSLVSQGHFGVFFCVLRGEATVFILYPFLLWGNAAESVMKHRLLFALEDFQVGQTTVC